MTRSLSLSLIFFQDKFLNSVSISDSPLLTFLPDDVFGDLVVGAFQVKDTGLTDIQMDLIGTPSSENITELYFRRNDHLNIFDGDAVCIYKIWRNIEFQ